MLYTLSGSSTGQVHRGRGRGLVNPFTSMMRGQPVYTYMVSVPPCEQTFNQISYRIGTFNPEEQQE